MMVFMNIHLEMRRLAGMSLAVLSLAVLSATPRTSSAAGRPTLAAGTRRLAPSQIATALLLRLSPARLDVSAPPRITPLPPSAARLMATPGILTQNAPESAPAAAAAQTLGKLSETIQEASERSTGEVAAAMASAYDHSSRKNSRGDLPLSWVEEMIERGEGSTPPQQRLQTVVQRLGFLESALNLEILRDHNEKYTVEIPRGVITDQKQSGRCWIFAGLNMIRATLVADKKVPPEFEFSENHLHFFNMLEKSNSHLEFVARRVYRRSSGEALSAAERRKDLLPDLGDGGWYEWFTFLAGKYGLAPKNAMAETISSEATDVMLSELQDSLAAASAEMMANAKQYKAKRAPNRAREIQRRGMARIWKILSVHLGAPPSRFEFRDNGRMESAGRLQVTAARMRTYTPREFAADFVKFDPKDYVQVSSFPSRKQNAAYEVANSAIGRSAPGERDFNMRFLNVGPERLEALAAAAIRGGEPVWFASDMGRDVDKKTGIMHPRLFDRASIYQFSPEEDVSAMTRKQTAYFDRLQVSHAMVLTGFDQPVAKGPIVKFKVENSWGEKHGSKGVFHLYGEWFRRNVLEIVVHKRFLNRTELKLWRGRAHQLRDDFY